MFSLISKIKSNKKVKFILLGLVALIMVIVAVQIISGIITNKKKNVNLGSVPDPETFFGMSAEKEKGDFTYSIEFNTDEITMEMVEAYMDLLSSQEYPFVLYDSSEEFYESTNTVWRFYKFSYNGTGEIVDPFDYQIKVEYYTSDVYDPFTRVTIFNQTHFALVSVETLDQDGSVHAAAGNEEENGDAPESESTSESESVSAVNGPTLPDPAAFLGGATPSEDRPARTSGWYMYFRTQIDEGYAAAHEYVELLSDPRFGFTLRDSFSDTTLYLMGESYFFDYTGNENIEPARDRYFREDFVDFATDVYIGISKNGRDEYTDICIIFSNDLEVKDLGDRASNVPDYVEGTSGSDSSGSGSYTPDFAKLPCLTCGGDGDCPTCDGYGTVERYQGGGEYVESTCPDCHGNRKCRTCGGSGTRD